MNKLHAFELELIKYEKRLIREHYFFKSYRIRFIFYDIFSKNFNLSQSLEL